MSLPQWVHFLADPPKHNEGAVVANWQSGVATSGGAGADLITVGDELTTYYPLGIFGIPIILVLIGGLTGGATITWRSYSWVFGAMYLSDTDNYIVGVDNDVMPVAVWASRGQVRVEIHSDVAGDNGASIRYEYSLKTY